MWRGLVRGWLGRSGAGFDLCFSLFCWENSLSSNASSNTIEACNSGIQQQRRANRAVGSMRPSTPSKTAVAELISTVETGGLDQLSAEEKVAVWQRFETLRNRLPLIDHQLIADAEAHHLSEEYCSSTLTQFLIRVLQLSPGEAATRIRAAAAVGPRTTMLGEKLEPRAAATGRAATRRCGVDGESRRLWNGPCTNSPALI